MKYMLWPVEEFWPGQKPGTHIGRVEAYPDKPKDCYDKEEFRFGFDNDEQYAKFQQFIEDLGEINEICFFRIDFRNPE